MNAKPATKAVARKAEAIARRLRAQDVKFPGYLTANELAAELGVSAARVRREARKAGHGVGQGSVYLIPIGEAAGMIATWEN